MVCCTLCAKYDGCTCNSNDSASREDIYVKRPCEKSELLHKSTIHLTLGTGLSQPDVTSRDVLPSLCHYYEMMGMWLMWPISEDGTL